MPKHIGKGIAKQALSSVLNRAKAEGKTAVYLYVIDTNTNAIAFYRSFGFQMESKIQFNAPDFKEELKGALQDGAKVYLKLFDKPKSVVRTCRVLFNFYDFIVMG